MAEALREAALEAGVSPSDARRRRGRLSRRRQRGHRRGVPGPEPAGLGRHVPARQRGSRESLGTTVKVGNDVQVATEAEFQLGAGRRYKSLLGVFWGTGVGGGIILNGKPWLGRGARRRDRPHGGQAGRRAVPLRATRAAWRPMRGEPRWRSRPARSTRPASKTDLFKIMKKHEHDRLTSGIWERALKQGDRSPRS